jgi:FdhE protein
MPTDPVTADVEQGIQRLVTVILGKRPQLEGILLPFAALFTEKTRLASALKDDLNATPCEVSGTRLAEGIPILAGISFAFLKPALARAFEALVPAVQAWFPATAAELDGIKIAQRNASLDLSRLAEAYVQGSVKDFQEERVTSEIGRQGLSFVLQLVLSAVLQSLAPSLAAQVWVVHWDRGYCPVCGSLPSISYLSKTQGASSEFLVGGGGQRYLHCAMCGHDWHVRRHLCAACECKDDDQHLYFQVPDAAGERVDVCRHCGHYLPCIDLRETDVSFHLDTAAVGMAHLDMLAQEKGFNPMVRAPWNTFE